MTGGRRYVRTTISNILLITFGGLMIYPLLWMLASSLKPANEIFSTTTLLPSHPKWENYASGWYAMPGLPFSVFLRNSILVSGLVVVGTVISASLVGYGFARCNFRLRKPLFAILLATMMLPEQALLIPRYVLFKQLHWIDTFLPLTIPPFFGRAFFVFLMVQFMRGIPQELDDAAAIDGCGPFQTFWRIILPLCTPAIVVAAIFAFLWSWNDFLDPLIYLSNPQRFTIPLGLRLFLDSSAAVAWGGMFAMSVVSIIPSLVIFFLGQRHFVEGISTTGLKG